MPLSGKGMLITAMDVDPADEQDFNLWYDREHVAERVALDGFLEARRWIAMDARPKYFSTYSTAAFEDLDSPAYAKALANQTEWSRRNIERFRNMMRVVARVTASRGQGRGSVLGVVRLRPAGAEPEPLRTGLRERLDPGQLPGIISLHLIESDPQLSRAPVDAEEPNPGAADWFVLIDGSDQSAVNALIEARFRNPGADVISVGTYRLMWDLNKSDL
jgi:hypothetical protein